MVAPLATWAAARRPASSVIGTTSFPTKYHGGLFLLDWTFGRVYLRQARTQSGSTYNAKTQVFLEAVGDNGFAPTAAAVDPLTGDLYVSIGGRGTRGAVYRIRHTEGFKTMKVADAAKLQPAPRSLDWKPASQEESARRSDRRRICKNAAQALVLMRRHAPHFEAKQTRSGRSAANAGHADRGLRQAAAELLAALDDKEQQRIVKTLRKPAATHHGVLGQRRCRRRRSRMPLRCCAMRKRSSRYGSTPCVCCKRTLGDLMSPSEGTVWEGYTRRRDTPAVPETVRVALRNAFPSGDADLDRELSRTLAMIEDDDPATLAKIAARLTSRVAIPIDDIHYLIVLARLKGQRHRRPSRSASLTACCRWIARSPSAK